MECSNLKSNLSEIPDFYIEERARQKAREARLRSFKPGRERSVDEVLQTSDVMGIAKNKIIENRLKRNLL